MKPTTTTTNKKHKRSSSARSTASTGLAATVRRMSDQDVRAIFESLHQHAPVPTHLEFQIVPVGPTGLKLSPPSFEFEDGLYVLLRPQKKKKNQGGPPIRVPPHLTDLVMPNIPGETCPWSLSGPQFPQPTAIQQRYCYPKGPSGYSSKKGGALWTMYGTDGKEDLEFRLLHVYFSAKRAVNKGVAIPPKELAAAQAAAAAKTPARNKKRPNNGNRSLPAAALQHHLATPPPRQRQRVGPYKQQQQQPQQLQSPANTSLPFHSNLSLCSSPLSFDMFLPPSPPLRGLTAMGFEPTRNQVSPPDPFRRHFLPEAALLTPSPFRRNTTSNGPSQLLDHHSIRQSPVVTHGGLHGEQDATDSMDNLSYDMDTSLQEIDSYWNDPLLSTIMMKPSLEGPLLLGDDDHVTNAQSLTVSLDGVQDTIRESILKAEPKDQAALVSLVASWARRVAKDPLTKDFTTRYRRRAHRGQDVHAHAHAHDDDTLATNNGAMAAV